MAVSVANTEASVDFFIDQLCPLSHKIFQYLTATLLKKSEALEATNAIYSHFADHLNGINRDEDLLPQLLKQAWREVLERKNNGNPSKHLKVFPYLNKFNIETRSVVILVDVFGLNINSVENLMDLSDGVVLKHLIEGRKNLLEVMQ